MAREGIHFSEAQKQQIANFEKTGQMAKAQEIILAQLNKQFGGAAAADANTYAGQLKQLEASFGALTKSVGELLLPIAKVGVELACGFVSVGTSAVSGVKEFFDRLSMGGDAYERYNAEIERSEKAHQAAVAIESRHAQALQSFTDAVTKARTEYDKMLDTIEKQLAGSGGSNINALRRLIDDAEIKLAGMTARMKWLQDVPGHSKEAAGQADQILKQVELIGRLQSDLRNAQAQALGEDQEAMRRRAEQMHESLRTPLEKFQAEMKNIMELKDSGLLGGVDAARARQKALQDLASAANQNNEPPMIHAYLDNSAAAYEQAFKLSHMADSNPLVELARQQVDALNKLVNQGMNNGPDPLITRSDWHVSGRAARRRTTEQTGIEKGNR